VGSSFSRGDRITKVAVVDGETNSRGRARKYRGSLSDVNTILRVGISTQKHPRNASSLLNSGGSPHAHHSNDSARSSCPSLTALSTPHHKSKPESHHLLPVPHPRNLRMSHLLLQLENTIHQGLTRWRASRHVDIDWHDSVASSSDAVTVVVVSSAIGTRTHGNDPSRLKKVSVLSIFPQLITSYLGHLIINLSQRRRHLVGERTGNNHDIGLTWRSTENDSHSILVVSWCREMHHLNSAAG
jgi:hypothetical protein